MCCDANYDPGCHQNFSQPRFGIFSVAIAWAASSFLSICGSGLCSPVCNKQCLPASTPHVGQGTASNSCGVTFVILTDQAYCDPYRKTVQIWTDSRLHVIGFRQKGRRANSHPIKSRPSDVLHAASCREELCAVFRWLTRAAPRLREKC